MPGRFEGLSDLEWKLFEDALPPRRRGPGRMSCPMRRVLNSLLYVLITGCRWCDLPRGARWASKSTAHRMLKRFSEDGTLDRLKARILGIAEERGLIGWEYGSIDGSFSPWEGRGSGSRARL
jgi:transposase